MHRAILFLIILTSTFTSLAKAELKLADVLQRALVETRSLRVQELNLRAAQIERLAPALDPLSATLGGSQTQTEIQSQSTNFANANETTITSRNFSVSYSFSPAILLQLRSSGLDVKMQEALLKSARAQVILNAATQYMIFTGAQSRLSMLRFNSTFLQRLSQQAQMSPASKSLINSKLANLQNDIQAQLNSREIALNELSRFIGTNQTTLIRNELRQKDQADLNPIVQTTNRASQGATLVSSEDNLSKTIDLILNSIPLDMTLAQALQLLDQNPAIIQSRITQQQVRLSGLIQLLSSTGPRVTLSLNSNQSETPGLGLGHTRLQSQSLSVNYSVSISGSSGLRYAANRMRERAAQVSTEVQNENLNISLQNAFLSDASARIQIESNFKTILAIASTTYSSTINNSNISQFIQSFDALIALNSQLNAQLTQFFVNRLNIYGSTGRLEEIIPLIQRNENAIHQRRAR